MTKHAPNLGTTIRPTARELRWFAHIDRHGPQSSEFLIELTRDTHRCKDSALRRLQALREAGYLFLPSQQRQIAKADFHPYIYDLTPMGFEHLSYEQPSEQHCRPTGHWWHGLWVASVSSAIEILASRLGHEYVPAERIIAIKDVSVGIPLTKGSVVPDQIFAIKSDDGYLAYALEVDRATEPVRSTAARKSLKRSVGQYREVLGQGLHKQHYGLKCELVVLWVFLRRAREAQWRSCFQGGTTRQKSNVFEADFPRWEQLQAAISEGPVFA